MNKSHPDLEPRAAWDSDWRVQVRLWVERRGQAVLGEGRAELLAAIDRTQSISAAARAMGISYRHAWKLVQETNQAAGEPLVEAAVGGLKGGGARLTARGRVAIEVFEQLDREVRSAAAALLTRTLAPAEGRPTLHLAAAISLQEAVGQLLADFALARPGLAVRTVFGASNELADHVLAGAPCDLFVSAGRNDLARLEQAGMADRRASIKLATNGLVVVAPQGSKLTIRRVADLLGPGVKRIAIATPSVPLGRSWKSYLDTLGCYEQLESKSIRAEDSRGVIAALASGRAQIALAFASDAAHARDCRVVFQIPARLASLEYWATPLSASAHLADSRSLVDYLGSPTARRVFARCGFSAIAAKTVRKARSKRQ